MSVHGPALPSPQLPAICVMLGKCLPFSEPQLLDEFNASGGPEASSERRVRNIFEQPFYSFVHLF